MKVAIIGAGATGLTAALKLAQSGHNVTVFEKSLELGGHASTFEINNTPIEKGYHHWFTSDLDIIDLMRELGLEKTIQWVPSTVGTLYDSETYDFMTPFDLLRYKPLKIHDRIKLGLSSLKISRIKDWHSLESVTAVEWLQKNINHKVYESFWGPMLRGKFGEQNYKKVSMAWVWGKMNTRFKSRKHLLSRELLGYPSGSFKELFDVLAARCNSLGVSIHLNSSVTAIRPFEQTRIELQLGAENQQFDCLISTTTCQIFNRITEGLTDSYRSKLDSVKYLAAILVILELKFSLSKYYWLNIADRRIPFVGAIEHTNLINASNYGGSHVLYLTNYLDQNSLYYKLPPEELLQKYLPFLSQINNNFQSDWITNFHYQKIPGAQPIIGINYPQSMPNHSTGIQNLYLANTSQIYPEDRGTNYSVRMGKNIAHLVEKKFVPN